MPTRLAGTALGLVTSRFLPSIPDEAHPVAQFGEAMGQVEDVLWRDDRAAGVAYAAIGAAIGATTATATRSTTATVAFCAAGQQLRDMAAVVADLLDDEDLDGARAAVGALVGRETGSLDHAGIAAAAIESVAENMVDAVFAPVFWGATVGPIGAGVHRALNTMDAMVGRRNDRYERFGWASARADDVANWVPARLFAASVALAVPGRARAIAATVRADAPAHPSPNAGVAEAAMAAALGCELGGPLRYGTVTENRPYLGSGMRPGITDLRRAISISERCENLAVAALATAAAGSWLWRHRTGGRPATAHRRRRRMNRIPVERAARFGAGRAAPVEAQDQRTTGEGSRDA